MEDREAIVRPTALELVEEQLLDAREAIREAENLSFHHSPEGTIERTHYERLVRMEVILDNRAQRTPTELESTRDAHSRWPHVQRSNHASYGVAG